MTWGRMGRRLAALGLTLAAAGGVGEARAGIVNLGTANNYNVFTLGDNTQSGTDAEGRVAVGGNASFGGSGYTIASKRAGGSTVNLVVGGNYSNTNNTVYGSAVIGGNATISNPTVNGNLAVNGSLSLSNYGSINGNVTHGGAYTNPNTTVSGTTTTGTTTLPVNFASEKNYLTSLSTALTNAANTGTVSFTGNSATGAQGGSR